MKKTVIGFALIATTVLAGTISATTADAAKEESTKVTIGFEDGLGSGPFAKNLNIARYPGSLNFGDGHEAGANGTAVVDLTPAKSQYLAVMDDRDAHDKGWKLSAQAQDMVDVKDATQKLAGNIKIEFEALQQYNMKPDGKNDFELTDPKEANAVETLTNLTDFDFNNTLVLELGAAGKSDVIAAKAGKDTKKAVITTVKKAQMNINSGAKEDQNYAGKIVWTLADTY